MLLEKRNHSEICVIGDVHGHLNTLIELIKKIPKDRPIFFLGDLIDKGKRSKEVIDLVRTHNSVLGNHDLFMIMEKNPRWKHYESLWLTNSGKMTHRSYGGKYNIRNRREDKLCFFQDSDWLRTLPLVIHFPNIEINNKEVYISHSRIDKSIHMLGFSEWTKLLSATKRVTDILKNYVGKEELCKETLAVNSILWEIFKDKKEINNTLFYNIFGHIHQENAIVEESFSAIDTQVYDNKLTALLLPELELIEQVTIEDTWGRKK